MSVEELSRRWYTLTDELEVRREEASGVLADLLKRHAEPHRRYHSLTHLSEIHTALDQLAEAGESAAEGAQVRLAAWFHDVIYDPVAADNEARSAVHAEAALDRMGLDRQMQDEVVRLVEMTEHHNPATEDQVGS